MKAGGSPSPAKEKTNPPIFSNAMKSRYRELNVERLKTLSEEVRKTLVLSKN
jgi:hypothetical protein